MKLAFQLAYRNLIGAGLRTWLNALVLSFSFVMIIFFNGLMDGWNQQAKMDTIKWEYGQGHLLHEDYDKYDPFSIQRAFGNIPDGLENLEPIFIRQASIYPEGRLLSVALKGIDANQKTLAFPTEFLKASTDGIPIMIGKRMAEVTELKIGDEVLMRWRDKNGTFDATNVTVAAIFDSNVGTIDNSQIWIAIDKLYEITGYENQATYLVATKDYNDKPIKGWRFESQQELLSGLEQIIAMKKYSTAILYGLLLAIALLAIFDTQVLSIFRRQKEIGTYIALGMTRQQVVGLFTVEGAMYSVFAIFLAALYGTPLLMYMRQKGLTLPKASQDLGVPISETIYPIYGFNLIIGTIIFVIIAATFVSFLPARNIAKLDPVAALKGKIQ